MSAAVTAPRSAVKVYEAGKQDSGKRIVAETVVQAPVDVVWRVLTSYERLAAFVPNLESCERLPSSRNGTVRAPTRAVLTHAQRCSTGMRTIAEVPRGAPCRCAFGSAGAVRASCGAWKQKLC